MSKVIISHTVGQRPEGPSLFRRVSVSVAARLAGHSVFTVPNQSMLSTLRLNDVVQLDESAYLSSDIQRGDVVVYRSQKHDNMRLPSRVIGLPNDTLELRNGVLSVNGLEVPEPYVDGDAAEQPHSKTLGSVIVPSGHVFLLGDFRDMSEDSRFIGPIPRELIIGRIPDAQGQREV